VILLTIIIRSNTFCFTMVICFYYESLVLLYLNLFMLRYLGLMFSNKSSFSYIFILCLHVHTYLCVLLLHLCVIVSLIVCAFLSLWEVHYNSLFFLSHFTILLFLRKAGKLFHSFFSF
jgi:hypothetical protein